MLRQSLLVMVILAAPTSWGQEAKRAAIPPELAARTGQAIDRAIDFYRKHQNEDGSFASGENAPAITGLAVCGMLRTGRVTPVDPMIARALKYLETFVQPDGGIYPKEGQRTYPTAIAIMAFAAANQDKRYQQIIDRAVGFLKKDQWDEGEGVGPENPKYGGFGYGKKSRPDLSNTAFCIEALKASGLAPDDPAYKRAMLFITRCQNYAGEGGNDQPQAALVNDGGLYYTAAEDYNPGGGTIAKGLRSYGSMTYAGLKSFIHAGVDRNDPRVKAAISWIKKHYTLKENPGLGQEGLFYYYHTFAKALAALGVDHFEDAAGKKHDWRTELLKTLLEHQRPDGSWTNSNQRWLESDARLVTAYVLMAMAHAQDR